MIIPYIFVTMKGSGKKRACKSSRPCQRGGKKKEAVNVEYKIMIISTEGVVMLLTIFPTASYSPHSSLKYVAVTE